MPSPILLAFVFIGGGILALAASRWVVGRTEDLARTRTCLLLVLGLAAVCYVDTFRNGFVWDDTTLIVDNPGTRNWHDWTLLFHRDLYDDPVTSSFYYRPLQMLSYKLDYSLWGPYPDGFHIWNILFHAGNGMLVFLLVRRVSRNSMLALACSALFVTHPIHTQAVTYISGRADPMCTFFLLLSLWFYAKARANGGSSVSVADVESKNDRNRDACAARNRSLIRYALAVVFYAGALCSKEFAVIFPVLLVAWELCFPADPNAPTVPRSPLLRRLGPLFRIAPFVVASLAYYLVRLRVFGSGSPPPSDVETGFSPLVLCLRALAGYVSLLIAPVNLHMEQTVAFHDWRGTQLSVAGGIGLVALLALACMYWRRSRPVTFALLWFLIFFLPVSNLWPLNATLAEHWMYFPSIGFLWAGCAIVWDLLASWERAGWQRARAAATLVLFAVMMFSVRTIWRNLDWHDEITFYQRTIADGGNTARVHSNLGMALQEQRKDLAGAEREYSAALDLDPKYDAALNNLGLLCKQNGDYARALRLFEQARAVHPWRVEPYINIGETYGSLGRTNDAWATFAGAVRLFPRSTQLAYRYGLFALRHSNLPLAEAELERGVRIQPDSSDLANALGAVAMSRNETEKAVAALTRAKQLDRANPSPYLNLAHLYESQDRLEQAAEELRGALRIQPYNPDFHYRIGLMEWHAGRTNDAAAAMQRALELFPNFAAARESLEKIQHGLPYRSAEASSLDLERKRSPASPAPAVTVPSIRGSTHRS